MAGEYDPAWTFRPTCPGRRIHPNMTPSSQRQLLPAEPPQTSDEEARDILAKAIRNQAEDGPSTWRAAIRAYEYRGGPHMRSLISIDFPAPEMEPESAHVVSAVCVP